MIDIMLLTVGITGLIIGAATDIKKREVPDWLNYSLVAAGLGLRLINSLITSDWSYFLYGAVGFALFFALACAMFYGGQWGGGDSKMLMGIGAIFATYPLFLYRYFGPALGFQTSSYTLSRIFNSFLFAFLINLAIAGALYGLIYSFFLATRNFREFLKELKKILEIKKYRTALRVLLAFSLLLLVFSVVFLKDLLLVFMASILILIVISSFYIWVFSKAVEKACMYKYVAPEQLTEGDWIAEEVKINGKLITGPKDLGISKEKIKKLIYLKKKNKVDKILIKEGIPFVPSFLVAIIVSLVYGNIVFWFI